MVNDKIMRHMLGTDTQVSQAIRSAVAGRKPQRVVPRWYYLLQVPRLVVPSIYRKVSTRMAATRSSRR